MADMNIGKCTSDSTTAQKLHEMDNSDCSRQSEINMLSIPKKSNHKIYKFTNKAILIPINIKNIKKQQIGLNDLAQVIPETFSWLKTGGNKIEDGRRNQGECGCCWAFSVATVLGDRYALKYNIEAPYPSVANLVSCGGPWVGSQSEYNILAKDQCECGGVTYGGAKWLESNYITTEDCWPFSTISFSNIAPNCPSSNMGDGCCIDDNNESYCCNNKKTGKFSIKPDSTFHILKHSDGVPLLNETITRIKQEIMAGPVSTTIFVPPNFQNWWNNHNNEGSLLTEDIFKPTGPPTINGHAIVITGWGKKGGVNYWEIRNSWGPAAYAYVAMSSDINKEYYYGIDIPIIPPGNNSFANRIENYQGGVISFEVGPLSDNIKKNTGDGGKPVMIINPKKSIDIFLISGIGVIFIFSVLLYIFI